MDNGISPEVALPGRSTLQQQSKLSATSNQRMVIDVDEEDKEEDEDRSQRIKTEESVNITDEENENQKEETVNYFTIAAKRSKLPSKRPFCSVCGYLGDYTCTRCGARFCSVRCNESHKETRCLKMSI
jgi:hypothetical protein